MNTAFIFDMIDDAPRERGRSDIKIKNLRKGFEVKNASVIVIK
jgi:hypothetical protein